MTPSEKSDPGWKLVASWAATTAGFAFVAAMESVQLKHWVTFAACCAGIAMASVVCVLSARAARS